MSFCSNCGTDIQGKKFCPECGNQTKEVNTKRNVQEKNNEPEKIIAEFTDGHGCNLKLTDQRLYAKSVGIEETYALRSVDGAGVWDDLEKYKTDKLEGDRRANSKRNWGVVIMVIGGFQLLGGIIALFSNLLETPAATGVQLVFGGLILYFGYKKFMQSKEIKVSLNSYIKIIISGDNKNYIFNKKSKESADIAKFLEKLEETLTKYS